MFGHIHQRPAQRTQQWKRRWGSIVGGGEAGRWCEICLCCLMETFTKLCVVILSLRLRYLPNYSCSVPHHHDVCVLMTPTGS
jgi:hypothetical protein